MDFGYTYDADGNIEYQTYYHRNQQTPPANGFGYDNLNRLTVADYLAGPAGTETFNYDLLGNRDSVNDTRSGGGLCNYGSNTAANEYTTVCGVTVLYDAAGNLKRDKSNYSYDYDYENRLTCIYIDNNANSAYDSPTDTLKATFEYDALGRRIEKVDVIAGTIKRYYYDDQRIVLQTSGSSGGSDEKYFVYGNYIDETLLMHNLSGTNTGDFYYGHDHLYSPTVLFGLNEQQSWVPIERYEYDVYGACRILTPDYSILSSSAYGNPFTFTGRELDALDCTPSAVGCTLYYYRARTYDPTTGRFLQRDKIRYVDGMNLYQYVISNPLENTDPLGLITITEGDEDSSVSITYEEPASNITIDIFTFLGPWSDYKYFGRAPMIWVIGSKRSWKHGRCIYETVEGVAMQEARLKTRRYSSRESCPPLCTSR